MNSVRNLSRLIQQVDKSRTLSTKIRIQPRSFSTCKVSLKSVTVGGPGKGKRPEELKNKPLPAGEAPWPAGIASFMRLPLQESAKGLDACFVGVPFDCGVSNRNGCRLGPRSIRNESIGLRPYNPATGAAPFDTMQVADIGDLAFSLYDVPVALGQIEEGFKDILSHDCVPLTLGGDHTITLPILRAFAKKFGPMAVIQVDAHDDVSDTWWGARETHATTFRRAVEEELVIPHHFHQIGLRGSSYFPGKYEWCKQQGIQVYPADDLWYKSLVPLMEKIKKDIGPDKPVYISFDIDAADPSVCGGTGTREIAGLTAPQCLEIIRGLEGLNLVGGDLVEVAPMYDPSGDTSHFGAYMLYEMLCSLSKNRKA